MPIISVIIPTYNRAHLIVRTLDSVQQQTFTEWECFVVDDSSTDNTRDIVIKYINHDTRFHYLKNEKSKGAPGARNTGLAHSNSQCVLFLDSDNLISSRMMEKTYHQFFEKKEEVDVVTCWSNIIDRKLETNIGMFNWVCNGDIQEGLLTGTCYVDTNAALIKRAKIEQIGGWSEDCPSFQEWDLHIRLSQVAKYTTVKEPLVDYYVNGDDTISKDRIKEIDGYLYIIGKYRVLWEKYSISYYQYGRRVLDMIDEIQDYKKYHRLFKLFPSLLKLQAKRQLHKIYQKVICWNK